MSLLYVSFCTCVGLFWHIIPLPERQRSWETIRGKMLSYVSFIRLFYTSLLYVSFSTCIGLFWRIFPSPRTTQSSTRAKRAEKRGFRSLVLYVSFTRLFFHMRGSLVVSFIRLFFHMHRSLLMHFPLTSNTTKQHSCEKSREKRLSFFSLIRFFLHV